MKANEPKESPALAGLERSFSDVVSGRLSARNKKNWALSVG